MVIVVECWWDPEHDSEPAVFLFTSVATKNAAFKVAKRLVPTVEFNIIGRYKQPTTVAHVEKHAKQVRGFMREYLRGYS